MQLTINERFRLLELMPEKSSYAGIKEIYRTSMNLSLTAGEAQELDGKHGDGKIQWDTEKALAMSKDVPMGEWMYETFRIILREMDDNDELGPVDISLFEKFILDYE
jgi:hypothetical protein